MKFFTNIGIFIGIFSLIGAIGIPIMMIIMPIHTTIEILIIEAVLILGLVVSCLSILTVRNDDEPKYSSVQESKE